MNPLTSRLKVLMTANPRAYDAMRMPFATARFAARRPHEADYGVFAHFRERHGLFLDVGANAGQSAASFRIYAGNPILSVEPNPFHRADLLYVGRMVRNLRFLIVGAGATEAVTDLYVPVYRGVPMTAEASLSREVVAASPSLRDHLGERIDSADFEIVETQVRILPLDTLELAPDFVKLDVQGHELAALEGLADTLERSRPVLLVEEPDAPTRAFLDARGYESRLYDAAAGRLTGEDREATNVVFLPAAG